LANWRRGRLPRRGISSSKAHRNEIHPSISFIEAIELYDMGIDVTQLKPKQIND